MQNEVGEPLCILSLVFFFSYSTVAVSVVVGRKQLIRHHRRILFRRRRLAHLGRLVSLSLSGGRAGSVKNVHL